MVKEKCEPILIQRDPKLKAMLCVKPQTTLGAKYREIRKRKSDVARMAKLKKARDDALEKGNVVPFEKVNPQTDKVDPHTEKVELHTEKVEQNTEKAVERDYIPKYDLRAFPLPPHVCEEHGVPSYSFPARAYPPYCFGTQYPPVFNGVCERPISVNEAPSLQPNCVTAPVPQDHGVVADTVPSEISTTDGIPSDEVRVITPPLMFPGVFVSGMPRKCKKFDIAEFFQGLSFVDVFLAFTNRQFSGEAFVVFPNIGLADLALQRDGQKMMGGTDIRVLPCSRQDYYNAIAAALDDSLDFTFSQAHPKLVIDSNVKEQTNISKSNAIADVSYPECPPGQTINLCDNISDHGRPIGEAKSLIEKGKDCDNDVAAADAVNCDLDSSNLQARRKVPENTNSKELTDITNHNAVADSSYLEHPQGQTSSISGPILRVCGPPYFADKDVIIGVFWEFDMSEDRIHIVLRPDGKPTGEIFLEFVSLEDATKALLKDKTMIGLHQLQILPATEEDLRVKVTERKPEHVGHPSEKVSDDAPKSMDSHDSAKKPNNEPMLAESHNDETKSNNEPKLAKSPNDETKSNDEPKSADSDNSLKKSNDQLKSSDSHLQGKPKLSNDMQTANTTVIMMRNVPPSADKYDIIEQFGEFELSPDRLLVDCQRNGIATGIVYVEFKSAEDAKKAFSKRKIKIHSKPVPLFLSSMRKAMEVMNAKW